jgi:hypothetical protein
MGVFNMNRIRSVLNYRKPLFWIVISAVIAAAVISFRFLVNPKNHETALIDKESASYEMMKPEKGEVLQDILPLSDDRTQSAALNNLNACVADAILTANAGQYREGDFPAEAHTVLKTVETDNTVTVFAMVLYMKFGYAESGFFETGGSHMPVAVTFEKNAAGEYQLKEYWIPRDGSGYVPSIREKFPSDIYEEALDTQKYVVAHIQSCYEQAIAYGKVNVDLELAKLIKKITLSPTQMSDPKAYIKEHIDEYRELIYYGKYTLRYCYSQFEKGGKSDLDGHIMAAACRDLLGMEDIDISAGTGQEWYDAFKKHAENVYEKNGEDYMKENIPNTWLLLQVLDETSN